MRQERRHPRLALAAPAFVADERGGMRRGHTLDVSIGGASLVVDEWIAVDTEVTVVVGSAQGTRGLPAVRGEVRWSQPARQGRTRIGIAFRELPREAEARLLAMWLTARS